MVLIRDELRKGEAGVHVLSTQPNVEQSSLSQQFSILRTRNLVVTRKEGLKVLYSASDPEIYRLLDIAKKIFNKQLVGVRNMLSQLQRDPFVIAQSNSCALNMHIFVYSERWLPLTGLRRVSYDRC